MNIIVAAGPVIIENEKVLVNKHGDTTFWKFPGGRVETFDELDLEQCAAREVKEEMGINIEIVRPLSTLMTKKDDETVVVLVHYLANRIGEVRPGSDIRKWTWLDIHNLPDDVAPNVKTIVYEYKATKQ